MSKWGDPPIKSRRIIEGNSSDIVFGEKTPLVHHHYHGQEEKGFGKAPIRRPVYDRANAFRLKHTLPPLAEQIECQIRVPRPSRL